MKHDETTNLIRKVESTLNNRLNDILAALDTQHRHSEERHQEIIDRLPPQSPQPNLFDIEDHAPVEYVAIPPDVNTNHGFPCRFTDLEKFGKRYNLHLGNLRQAVDPNSNRRTVAGWKIEVKE